MSWSVVSKGLAAPFRNVRVRIGSRKRDKSAGMILHYIDARDLMDRLDAVVGPQNWTTEFREVAGRVVCRLGIRPTSDDPFIYKEDGAGETDMEGEKGALSDAFKRVGVHFGAGRYLYSEPNIWVDLTDDGKRMAKGEEARAIREYYARHFDGEPEPVPYEEPDYGSDPPPPQEEYEKEAVANRQQTRNQPERDVGREVDAAVDLVAERKKLNAKQFQIAERLWGKPIPSDRRFQIMDWVLGKMGLRVQKQIDTIEKCRQAMRWIDAYEGEVGPDRRPGF